MQTRQIRAVSYERGAGQDALFSHGLRGRKEIAMAIALWEHGRLRFD